MHMHEEKSGYFCHIKTSKKTEFRLGDGQAGGGLPHPSMHACHYCGIQRKPCIIYMKSTAVQVLTSLVRFWTHLRFVRSR